MKSNNSPYKNRKKKKNKFWEKKIWGKIKEVGINKKHTHQT